MLTYQRQYYHHGSHECQLVLIESVHLPDFKITSIYIMERVFLLILNHFLEGAKQLRAGDIDLKDFIRMTAVHNAVEIEI